MCKNEKNEYWTFCSHVLFVHMVLFILRTSLTFFFFCGELFFFMCETEYGEKKVFFFPT